MSDKCADNPRDCPLLPRVEALEKANEQHGNTHREIFSRLNDVERDNAVQNAKYDTILEKLDGLTKKVEALEAKPGKRWESIVGQVITLVAAAIVGMLLGRVGL